MSHYLLHRPYLFACLGEKDIVNKSFKFLKLDLFQYFHESHKTNKNNILQTCFKKKVVLF